MYEGDKPEQGIYCIHPEFLDSNDIPVEENIEIDLEGRATMWILFDEMRDFHRKKLSEGTRGYFSDLRPGAQRTLNFPFPVARNDPHYRLFQYRIDSGS